MDIASSSSSSSSPIVVDDADNDRDDTIDTTSRSAIDIGYSQATIVQQQIDAYLLVITSIRPSIVASTLAVSSSSSSSSPPSFSLSVPPSIPPAPPVAPSTSSALAQRVVGLQSEIASLLSVSSQSVGSHHATNISSVRAGDASAASATHFASQLSSTASTISTCQHDIVIMCIRDEHAKAKFARDREFQSAINKISSLESSLRDASHQLRMSASKYESDNSKVGALLQLAEKRVVQMKSDNDASIRRIKEEYDTLLSTNRYCSSSSDSSSSSSSDSSCSHVDISSLTDQVSILQHQLRATVAVCRDEVDGVQTRKAELMAMAAKLKVSNDNLTREVEFLHHTSQSAQSTKIAFESLKLENSSLIHDNDSVRAHHLASTVSLNANIDTLTSERDTAVAERDVYRRRYEDAATVSSSSSPSILLSSCRILPSVLTESLCYLSFAHVELCTAPSLRSYRPHLPCWVPQHLLSRLWFGAAGVALLRRVELVTGFFVWATELSNVHDRFVYTEQPITVAGVVYPGGPEVYFQLQKSVGTDDHAKARRLTLTPEAPVPASRLPQHAYEICGPNGGLSWRVETWADEKDAVMVDAVKAKFIPSAALTALLRSTYPHPLVQLKPNDEYWGTGNDGKGENKLGEILMGIRRQMNETANPSSSSSRPSLFSLSALSAIRVADTATFNTSLHRAREDKLSFRDVFGATIDVPPYQLAYDRLVASQGEEWYYLQAVQYRETDEYHRVEERFRVAKQYKYNKAANNDEQQFVDTAMVVDANDTPANREAESIRVFNRLRDDAYNQGNGQESKKRTIRQ